MAIRKVLLANGKEDKDAGWGKPRRKRVLSDGVAYEVTRILEQNIQSGTGYPNAVIGRAAAGKTGTTDNHADAWFCGYTPNLQAAVWVGHPAGQIPMDNVHGIRVAGGTFPAEIWGKFMREALMYSPPRSGPSRWTGSIGTTGAVSTSTAAAIRTRTTTDGDYYEPEPETTEEQEEEPAPAARRAGSGSRDARGSPARRSLRRWSRLEPPPIEP